MQSILGEEYPAFLASYDQPPAKGLRLNPNYPLSLAKVAHLMPIPYEPYGYYCDEGWGADPLHAAGAYYLQDPSAMLTVNALDFAGDETVLDLCAAPGGKSTQLAARIPHGTLVCNEIDLGRAKILLGNIERLGITNAIVTNLTPEAVAKQWAGRFDVVVVDAPCSGEGMFRKNPLAVGEWSEQNVQMCAARQRAILDQAVLCLAAGGRLVYSTCTFAPQENEQNVAYLTHTYPLKCVQTTLRVQKATQEGLLPYTRRFYPHQGQGEGHFVAVLQKTDEPARTVAAPYYAKDALSPADCRLVRDFLRRTLDGPIAGTLHRMGDNVLLYHGALSLPAKGLLCAGVRLGELVKGRLEPHHMLFGCLPLANRLALSPSDPRLAAYLHGESITLVPSDAPVSQGYATLCVDEYPLGGGKMVGDVFKNRYPKGLRI